MIYKFVEYIPEALEPDTLYISIEYATAVHKCCCGCGNEVVTPLSPTDWQLTFNGETVSLSPSIGNWNFDCQSHYFIRKNKVEWATAWTREEIQEGRAEDSKAKSDFYKQIQTEEGPG
ncbi:MAG: hypothetical protein Roseis2KO_25090 [Roseivirga sp.]